MYINHDIFFFKYLQNNIYYHLYHCHLDVRWFQLSLLSELPNSRDIVKHSAYSALNDLVQLSRNRFKKVNLHHTFLIPIYIIYYYFITVNS